MQEKDKPPPTRGSHPLFSGAKAPPKAGWRSTGPSKLLHAYTALCQLTVSSIYEQTTRPHVSDTASYIRGWVQMVLTPNDLFSWNNKYSKYTNIYINNAFTSYLLAMHINSLCACWHPEAVKGSSSLSSRRLLISPRITSSLFLCPESTDAPCSRPEDPFPPLPKMALPFTGSAHTPLPGSNTPQNQCISR